MYPLQLSSNFPSTVASRDNEEPSTAKQLVQRFNVNFQSANRQNVDFQIADRQNVDFQIADRQNVVITPDSHHRCPPPGSVRLGKGRVGFVGKLVM
jgi:uncharacterized protein YjbI with pentapeptide repeats